MANLRANPEADQQRKKHPADHPGDEDGLGREAAARPASYEDGADALPVRGAPTAAAAAPRAISSPWRARCAKPAMRWRQWCIRRAHLHRPAGQRASRLIDGVFRNASTRAASASVWRSCSTFQPDWIVGSFSKEYWPLALLARMRGIKLGAVQNTWTFPCALHQLLHPASGHTLYRDFGVHAPPLHRARHTARTPAGAAQPARPSATSIMIPNCAAAAVKRWATATMTSCWASSAPCIRTRHIATGRFAQPGHGAHAQPQGNVDR